MEVKKLGLEHPQITEMNRKGYLNALQQPEHMGTDIFGNELLAGDEVVEYNGELALKEDLLDFLDALGFTFKTL
jgi:hypothetical protein